MSAYDAMFMFFSLGMLLSGVLVIFNTRAVASATCLVLLFVFTAGLYVLLQAFFLALIQVLVYAGAIMVLFLFVIMLLDMREPRRWWSRNLLGLVGGPLIGAAFALAAAATLSRTTWPPAAEERLFRGELAQVVAPVFAHYLLPVEITALLLLVATIGVVILGRREEAP